MISHQQVLALFEQLQQQHPQAFKRNFLFYSLLKTKGLMDELKEVIPWVLALMIFVSSAYTLSEYLAAFWTNLNNFQHMGAAILIIMVIMRLYLPYIMWQIKHSSESLFEHLKNTHMKLSIVIMLQAINLMSLESSILQYVLFFFAISFGFVRLYKESLFLEKTTIEQHYYLQQIRRATLWAYKKQIKLSLKLKFNAKKDTTALATEHQYYQQLYADLKKYENKMCKTYKYEDLDSYMDKLN